ncbi:caprin-2-like [Mya arenaria]|uniref:caprin-2-like n=1 Tax=Mya arenaria TaxID=6604 RepID=UPI0022E7B959|nr:caprin-2-like [Mya arenaria]XP_052778398.1 caprin-2-like [Mya arenaria]
MKMSLRGVHALYHGLVWISLAVTVFGQFSVLAQTATVSSQTDSSAVRYSLLLKELATVTEGRATLTRQLSQYQESYLTLRDKIAVKKAACMCFNTTAVAFTAHLDEDITVLGADQPIPFRNVTLNEGNAYDARHAEFRAPVNGTYQFYVTISTRAGYQVVADIMLNGTPVVKLRSGNDNQVNTVTNGVALNMKAGDDLWVQHDHSISDSNRLFKDEGLLTTFSGHLVNRL